ncbi:MAG: hypothetical protein HQL32_17330, partial [Planctomycetes bacterium]|nr:hypothetical protein [Planctomycetota bacterium]
MKHKRLSILTLALISFGTIIYADKAGNSRLGMDRDSYGVYDRKGGLSTQDYPYFVGQAYKPSWTSEINPARNKFNWSQLDKRLKQAYEQNQRLYLQVHVSYKSIKAPPKWVYDSGVPMVKGPPDSKKKSRGGATIYPYWLDSKFISYYKEMVSNLGEHVRNNVSPQLQKILSFVRVDCGIHGDDRPYDDASAIPAKYKISKSEWMDFKFMAYDTYKKAFQEGNGPIIPLMFKHASPEKYKSEWDWIQNNIKHSYGVRYLGDTRGHHFTGSQLTTDQFRDIAVDSNAGIFSRNEMDQAWQSPMAQSNLPLYFYWTAIEQLHPGLSIWDILGAGSNYSKKGKYEFTFEFFNRWAADLVPATAGGG